MHTGISDNEARAKNCSFFSSLFASSSSSSSSSSLVKSSFQQFSSRNNNVDLVENKRRVVDCEKSLVDRGGKQVSFPFPSIISSPGSAAAECSSPMYSVQPNVNSETGPYLFGQNVTAIPEVAPFPVITPQQGFVRYGTEYTPVYPGLNNSWSPQLVGNPYQYCCFPYNGMCVPSTVLPNLKQRTEESWNSHNPQQMESLFGHFPGSFKQESVFHASLVPFQAMFQNPVFSTSARGPTMNHFQSGLLTKNQEFSVCATSQDQRDDNPFVPTPVRGPFLNYSLPASLAKSEELNVCGTTQGSCNDVSLDGDALVPVHKRKLGCQGFLSNTSFTKPVDGNKKTNLDSSARPTTPLLLEHSSAVASQDTRPSLVSPSSELQSRHPPAANPCRIEEDKEIEGKGWVLLVQKELRNTDVGNLGRIVIPKKDAEANLPELIAKDGVMLQMEDMTFSIKWKFKYRYWPNNKSRMYVMENTGEFVRAHNLQTGDFFIVYKERRTGKYIVRGKKGMKPLYAGDIAKPEEGETEAKDRNLTKNLRI